MVAWVIVKGISIDHDGQSYKVREIKTGRVIACNTRHICKMQIMTEQYLNEGIVKVLDI